MDYGYYNMDCMEGMKQFPDKYFDIAITDPPYFSGPERRGYYGRKVSPIGVQRHYEPSENWEVPGEDYFRELERVSKHQIIWGCNYFDWNFPTGRIVWDKCNGSNSFSDCEIASCSLHDSVRLFRYMWNGMMQGKSIEEGWIQQGWKVLDTHVGSASSLIAYEEAGIPYVGFEIDPKRYELSKQRLEEHRAQLTLHGLGMV